MKLFPNLKDIGRGSRNVIQVIPSCDWFKRISLEGTTSETDYSLGQMRFDVDTDTASSRMKATLTGITHLATLGTANKTVAQLGTLFSPFTLREFYAMRGNAADMNAFHKNAAIPISVKPHSATLAEDQFKLVVEYFDLAEAFSTTYLLKAVAMYNTKDYYMTGGVNLDDMRGTLLKALNDLSGGQSPTALLPTTPLILHRSSNWRTVLTSSFPITGGASDFAVDRGYTCAVATFSGKDQV